VRKAGGVYYTPEYIVDYIVAQTVGRLIEGRSPEDIASLRIVDPACGSGSFLLGAYSCLLVHHKQWYSAHPTDKAYAADWYAGANGEIHLSLSKRAEILQNNIFGVDIDREAVEVSIMSLYLKMLDEGFDGWRRDLFFVKGAILPGLDGNIKCGNSLVAPDFFEGQLTLNNDDLKQINAFDWQAEFPAVFKDGGFDAVVGNPPYVRIQTIEKNSTDYFKQTYKSAEHGNYDLYILFIEQALNLLKKNALYGMILPNKFFTAEYGNAIRNIISDGQHLFQINDFTTNQVFNNATTYTCLLFLTKHPNEQVLYQKIGRNSIIPESLLINQFSRIEPRKLINKWIFTNDSKSELLKKLNSNASSLGEISRKIFKGSSTGNDDVYLLSLVNAFIISMLRSQLLIAPIVNITI
jgi:type I restriction-modification system DNA methylase subunit